MGMSVERSTLTGELPLVRTLHAKNILFAAQIMWRSEGEESSGINLAVFDDDGTIGDPFRKLSGRSYSGISLDVVQYFRDSKLWHTMVISNNPLFNGRLRRIVGEKDIFVPKVKAMLIPYKNTDQAVNDVVPRLMQIENQVPVQSVFMVGDRFEDEVYLNRLVSGFNRESGNDMRGHFIKLPCVAALNGPLARWLP